MDTLCEDLLLLAIDAYRGGLGEAYALGYGLMGAELVRLAATGRIVISDDEIVVTSAAPTGDAELDTALTRITESPKALRPADYVRRPRARISGGYLERLEAAGVVVCHERRFMMTRWQITDPSRLADARGRLDAIATSTGEVDLTQAAYGGLAHAIGLGRRLYRGWGRRAERARLREIAEGRSTAVPVVAADSPDLAVVGDSVDAALDAGRAAVQASTSAATDATIYAATEAALRATTHAVAHAAHSAAAGGHGGGGHGGH